MKYIKIVILTFTVMNLLSGCGSDTDGTDLQSKKDTIDPTFTSPREKSITEGKSRVITIKANDENNITYSITNSEDGDKFSIDANSGDLSFVSVPDFENPTDKNKDGAYQLLIEAKDLSGNSALLSFKVIVTDDTSDNGPTFISSNSKEIQENLPLEFTVLAQTENSQITYALSGGVDQNRFEIDANSGELSFLNFIPDFEHGSDADKNNTYEIIIQASDDHNRTSFQNFTAVVTDDANDLIYIRKVYKTGVDDGIVSGSAFGDDRNFIANANGTVSVGDRTWEDSNHVNTNIDFFDARDYCTGLNYGDIGTWRLPNRHELFEIVNYGKSGTAEEPTIDDVFNHKNNGIFWTSQELVGYGNTVDDTRAFVVRFFDALTTNITKTESGGLRVRCVSGPTIEDHQNFTLSGDSKTVTDNSTGLVWENDITNLPLNWHDAKARCEALVLDDKNDWRLPNINEIRTNIPNYSNEILFEHLSPIGYDTGHGWSSTLADTNHARYYENYWDQENNRDILSVMYHEYTIDNEINNFFNRCIRGGHL